MFFFFIVILVNKLKVYSYVVRDDRGLTPNPFWDHCTLALDQSLIRKIAKVGDWVVGLKEKSEKLEDHYLLFAMQITEKITFDEYWTNPRFQLKRPDFSVDEEIFRIGDNIYELDSEGEFVQHYSAHSQDNFKNEEEWMKQQRDDLHGEFVLVSDRKFYHYFGREPVKIPSKKLVDILYCDIGHKCIADPEVPQEFLDFIAELNKQEKIGFINPPEIWPKDDETYVQCWD